MRETTPPDDRLDGRSALGKRKETKANVSGTCRGAARIILALFQRMRLWVRELVNSSLDSGGRMPASDKDVEKRCRTHGRTRQPIPRAESHDRRPTRSAAAAETVHGEVRPDALSRSVEAGKAARARRRAAPRLIPDIDEQWVGCDSALGSPKRGRLRNNSTRTKNDSQALTPALPIALSCRRS